MQDRMVRVQVGEPSCRTQGLHEDRRGRLNPAPNRGRNHNIPPVAYLPPIEEPEEIEMGVIGLERFDGARRRSGTNHLGEEINLQRVNIRHEGNNSEALETSAACDLTIVQAWTMFGYGTLTLPSYVSYDAGSNEYVLKSNIIQKILCFMQHGLAVADEVKRIAGISYLINNNPNPFTFIQIGSIFVSIGTRAWFFKVAFMNMNNLLSYHNAALESNAEEYRVSGSYVRHSKKIGMLSFVAAACFTLLMFGLDTIILLNDYDSHWTEAGGPGIVQAYACYARRVYLWKDLDTCGSEDVVTRFSSLSYSDIFYGIQGLITFINAETAFYQKIVGLDAINAAFYHDSSATMDDIQNGDAPVRQAYDLLKQRTDYLSYFGGLLLMLQLLEIGMNIPQWSFAIFSKNPPVTLFIFAIMFGFFAFVFLSCMGAHTCERIKDEMMGQPERPYSAREMIVWMFGSVWNKVGIGLTGLCVLNYAVFGTYMTFVGAWIMVLYEVRH